MNKKTFRTKNIVIGLAVLVIAGGMGWKILTTHAGAREQAQNEVVSLKHEGDHIIVPEGSPLRQTVVIDTLSQRSVAVPFSLPAVVEVDPANIDLSSIFVTASAKEQDVSQIYIGQSATVMFDAYPDHSLHGKIRSISEMLDPDTRTLKVRMVFDNHDGRLKPGMFAQAIFFGRSHPGFLVPMTAPIQDGFYSRIFVEVAPWEFEKRVVTLGASIGEQVEILSGLRTGERIVVKEGVLLND